MDLAELKSYIDNLIKIHGEDCYAKVSDIPNEIDIYEVRGQLITNIELDDR